MATEETKALLYETRYRLSLVADRPKTVPPSNWRRRQEQAVYKWLCCHGLKAEAQADSSRFDVLCNGKHVEIKCALFHAEDAQRNPLWRINFHRHNVLDESRVDLYILRLVGGPKVLGLAAIHLVVPAPIKVKSVAISCRSLLMYWGRYANRVDLLGGGSDV